jgi:fructose-specific phosphotransferase system component IIB
MSDVATRLAEARTALHQLMLGKQVVKIETTGLVGQAVTYTSADIDRLKSYIKQLAIEAGESPRRGSIKFYG